MAGCHLAPAILHALRGWDNLGAEHPSTPQPSSEQYLGRARFKPDGDSHGSDISIVIS